MNYSQSQLETLAKLDEVFELLEGVEELVKLDDLVGHTPRLLEEFLAIYRKWGGEPK